MFLTNCRDRSNYLMEVKVEIKKSIFSQLMIGLNYLYLQSRVVIDPQRNLLYGDFQRLLTLIVLIHSHQCRF